MAMNRRFRRGRGVTCHRTGLGEAVKEARLSANKRAIHM